VVNNLKDEIQAVISPPPPKEAEEKKEGEEVPVPPSEEGEDQDYEHYGEEGLSDAEAEGKDKEGGDGAGDTGLDEQATKALEEAEEGTRVSGGGIRGWRALQRGCMGRRVLRGVSDGSDGWCLWGR
jgi:hypothetical protein